MKKRSNFKIISHIALLLLVLLMAVAATFSWYNRTEKADATTYLLEYTQSGKTTSNSPKTVETFAGTNKDGIITYSDTKLTATDSISTLPGKVNYFKTVITDTKNAGASALSLYFSNLSCSENVGGAIHIGIVSPEKTYKSYTGSTENSKIVFDKICLEDNIIVESGKSVEIYWFIEIDSTTYTGGGTITLGDMYYTIN